ncbi:hypothetical protein HF324_27640 [Chitinophaga oryzae]|uniref:Terpene synthase n=1 Tax=Chitinophaga oryzae TaxID=2725414 RepID=A0AAE6ZMK4_9BACT|nr:hypothetical protein [Chitinophaga oryzae]QJB34898.1 hypothetical protein HF329_27780 [Chitinophaga oryzae]QJB41409.1 hypothetical protein HF324_27640 [Chitinophaga oryzae]
MQLYHIPKLYYPFPSYTDVQLEKKVESHTLHWLRRFELLNEDQVQFYADQRFSAMIVRSYPFADFEKLCIWCDLNTLLFIVDDRLDEDFVIQDRASLTAYTDTFLQVLHDGIESIPINKQSSELTALDDFWKRAKNISPSAWQDVFIQNIKDMFAGGSWQLEHILENKKPKLKDYKEFRQYLGAAHLATDSLPFMSDIDLPYTIYSAPDVKLLTEQARNIVCYSNDLFSLAKEVEQSEGGAEFNLVSVISNEENCSLQEAILRAVTLHDETVRDFIKTEKRIYTFDSQTNESLKKYARSLEFFIKGNEDWSTKETTRYPHVYLA